MGDFPINISESTKLNVLSVTGPLTLAGTVSTTELIVCAAAPTGDTHLANKAYCDSKASETHSHKVTDVLGEDILTTEVTDLNDYVYSRLIVFRTDPSTVSNLPTEWGSGWEGKLEVCATSTTQVVQFLTDFYGYDGRVFMRNQYASSWSPWHRYVSNLAPYFNADINMLTYRVTNMGTAVADTDATTKAYVDFYNQHVDYRTVTNVDFNVAPYATTNGVWRMRSNGTNFSNHPTGTTSLIGLLYNMQYTTSGTVYAKQIYDAISDKKTYTRFCLADVWSSWVENVSAANYEFSGSSNITALSHNFDGSTVNRMCLSGTHLSNLATSFSIPSVTGLVKCGGWMTHTSGVKQTFGLNIGSDFAYPVIFGTTLTINANTIWIGDYKIFIDYY
jgi:hypothetical protein